MTDIYGTQNADFIVGTVGDDTVRAWEGNDVVLGLSGRDLIFGNAGGDFLAGNGGADFILAGRGDDFVLGGRNNDVLFGDLGNDLLSGDLDNDIIIGSSGLDVVLGGAGFDTVHGGSGNDIVRGGKNNDRLWGGRGDDLIFGDFGADMLTGNLGFDTFVIGRRNDTNGFASTGGATLADADTITDFTPGVDRIELIGGLTFDQLDRIPDNGSTVLRDRETGQYLAILQGVEQVNREDFIPFTPAPTVPPANTESDPEPTPAPELPAETEVLEDSNEAIDTPDSDTSDETNDNPNNDTPVEVDPTPVSPPTPPAPPVPTNQSPTVDADKTLTVLRGDDNLVLKLTSPTDPEGDPLTITVTAVPDGDRGLVLNGGTALAANDTLTPEEIANLVFDPNEAATPGTTDFTYTVSDGVNPAVSQTIKINIATPGEIRGTQWNDLNSNGIRDIGEPGIVDRTVYLDLNNNDRLDAEEPSTTTDDTGGYVFTDLAPGTYTVAEVRERDWRTTAPGAIVEGSGTGGNVVVSRSNTIREYTQAGTPVTGAKAAPAADDDARDLIVSSSGEIHTYNGTFDPVLSSYNPNTETWTSTTYTGWSTVNNGTYGGITIDGNYIYVTDMRTFGDDGADAAQGIVRFDLSNDTAIRFADSFNFIDLTLGMDGLLYGLRDERTVYVYDPQTLNFLWTTSLNFSRVRGIAVDRDGDIFGASWDNNIYHFDNNGRQLNSIDGGARGLADIDISYDDQLVIGGDSGHVILTDTTLSNLQSFTFGGFDVAFVSFSTYQTPSRLTNPTHTVTVSANEAIENVDFGNISLLEPVVEPD